MNNTFAAIPEAVRPYAGQITDTDTHEYTPVNHWVEQFGSIASDFADALNQTNMPIRQAVARDDTAVNAETVWKTKFAAAPGAFDFRRRL